MNVTPHSHSQLRNVYSIHRIGQIISHSLLSPLQLWGLLGKREVFVRISLFRSNCASATDKKCVLIAQLLYLDYGLEVYTKVQNYKCKAFITFRTIPGLHTSTRTLQCDSTTNHFYTIDFLNEQIFICLFY